MNPNGFGNLIADGVYRRHRGEWILKDHRNPAAANGRQILVGAAQQLGAFEPDRAGDLRPRRQKTHDGKRRNGFSGTGFSHDAEHFSRHHVIAESPHRGYRTRFAWERHGQIADFQQRLASVISALQFRHSGRAHPAARRQPDSPTARAEQAGLRENKTDSHSACLPIASDH